MDLLRHYVMNTRPLVAIEYEWIVLFAQLIALSFAAKFAVSWLERSSKEGGLHYI
jgi:hypothetical protein